MHNTYSVWACGTEYVCRQFWNTDTNTSGVDIYDPLDNDKHIGEIMGISIPDTDAEPDEIEAFEAKVTEFIEENL